MSGKEEMLRDGMKRMLKYHSCIVEDYEINKMCERCESWMGKEHDYNDCTDCQGFKFYCELQQYRFSDSF